MESWPESRIDATFSAKQCDKPRFGSKSSLPRLQNHTECDQARNLGIPVKIFRNHFDTSGDYFPSPNESALTVLQTIYAGDNFSSDYFDNISPLFTDFEK